jgi:hypothetical protein
MKAIEIIEVVAVCFVVFLGLLMIFAALVAR